jgi:hypothetical protein
MKFSILKMLMMALVVTVMIGNGVQAAAVSVEKLQAAKEKIDNALGKLVPKSYDDQTEEDTFNLESVSATGVIPCQPLPPFTFMGVDDQGLNNSQIFSWQLGIGNPPQDCGAVKKQYDLEGLDSTSSPFASCLWASSGDNDGGDPNCGTGCLYHVSKIGHCPLTLAGDICTRTKDLEEVDALAFRPNEQEIEVLWGWAQHEGLFVMPTQIPISGLCGTPSRTAVEAQMVCQYVSDEPTSEPDHNKFNDLVVEDMTWAPAAEPGVEGLFYIAIDHHIYTIDANCGAHVVCANQTEIEALEYIDDGENGLIAVGFHHPDGSLGRSSIAALDPTDPTIPPMNMECKFLEYKFPTDRDVEGLAHP